MATKEPEFTRQILHDLKRIALILRDKFISSPNKIEMIVKIIDEAILRETNAKRGNSIRIRGPIKTNKKEI